ncbi:MAG: phospholipase C, phosphocholine-specific [Pseudomonadota bacterium]|nr:phospholipase C, phosphocholine-specific [Pseudomonadota bacterium]
MQNNDRRKFLHVLGAGTIAASLPDSISRALAIPANDRTGTIRDVEHIVILTQENQSFDHYFGTLRGVRGFADPRAVKLPNGRAVWYQPDGKGGELPPFRVNQASLGLSYLPGTAHDWNSSHAAWNHGQYDQWVPNKSPMTMAYMKRDDIPYHFALADAFTVCDAYHCSVMGPTDPNRYHMWTGWTGNDGKGGGPVLSNAEVGYDWTTYPERLQAAGVSWKVYQDVGTGLTGAGYWGWTDNAYIGNYGDNALLYFHQYQNALPGNPLADNAKTGTDISAGGTLFDQFSADVRNGTLPQVSWIAPPEAYSEHPNWPANFGAWYISQILDILTSNPEVWSKTVLFLNWDENDGGFDHVVSPTPPATAADGLSTVATTNEIFAGDASFVSGPIGLGTRVPLIAISPWSKGGYVNSQVFDHTSLIRFIEKRFGVHEPNITAWRSSVAGDLTSVFNFADPNGHKVKLPSTDAYLPPDALRHPSITVDASNILVGVPAQEPGMRPARALPYEFDVTAAAHPGSSSVRLHFANTGAATAVFQVRSAAGELPRSYTVEPGKLLADNWSAAGAYDLAVYGPNGFFRSFAGSMAAGSGKLAVETRYLDDEHGGVELEITNGGDHTTTVTVSDAYTGKSLSRLLAPRESFEQAWMLAQFHGWYDLVVSSSADSALKLRLAGHVETGRESQSDPVLGGLVLKA